MVKLGQVKEKFGIRMKNGSKEVEIEEKLIYGHCLGKLFLAVKKIPVFACFMQYFFLPTIFGYISNYFA